MKLSRVCCLTIFSMATFVPCFAHHIAVVVNKSNHVENIPSARLAKMVQSEIKQWPDGSDIILVFHHASSGGVLTRAGKGLDDGALRFHRVG